MLAPRARGAQRGPLLSDLTVSTKTPFFGDGPRLATLGAGAGRDVAVLHFRLGRPAAVTLETLVTGQGIASEEPASVGAATLETREVMLGAGGHSLRWSPDATLLPRTYVLRVRARADDATVGASAVVRLLGVDAGLQAASVTPGGTARLVVSTDAQQLAVQVLRCGPETEPTNDNITMHGEPVGGPVTVQWSRNVNRPARLDVPIGATLESGLYAIRLEADDGRIGFAPLVVRPTAPKHRVAVVLPTTTWQAYNFYDVDGDGWGDTWYARWKTDVFDPRRPHSNRGVPHRYRSYDLQFIRWLARTDKQVDVYADEDIARFPTAESLRAAYDLLVFPGHTEYVTTRLYDLVTAFRNSGGNLAFLSANNFFRRVDRRGRAGQAGRRMARPEAARGGALRRPVHRQRPRRAAAAVHGHRRRRCSVGVRGDRPEERRRVRHLRDRDRRPGAKLPASDAGAREDSRPVRARPLRRDDLLRARERRTGVLGRHAQLRWPGAALARSHTAARERLATPRSGSSAARRKTGTMTALSVADRRTRFRELHAGDRLFVMPNPWDVGSARLLAARGFEALATTSAGFAWSLGKLDQQVTRAELVVHVAAIAGATPLPLNVDSERCYPDDPGGVAETVRSARRGRSGGLLDRGLRPGHGPHRRVGVAAERVAIAAEAAHALDEPMVLTGRAENHIHGRDDLDDTIARLIAYRDAGADCVYAPGLSDLADIAGSSRRSACP